MAIVDVGSNSTRLEVAEVGDGRVLRELTRETTVTRLGDGVDTAGRLRSDAIERVLAVIERYRETIDELGAGCAHCVLTSAVRDAANGAEFAVLLGERYALEVHMLDGDQEARLTYLGAVSERPTGEHRRTLVIDIGGGSTELVTGHGSEIDFHISTQIGVVRHSERHVAHDPPREAELRALRDDVRRLLERSIPPARRGGTELALAVAGTPTSLAAIAQRLDPYDPAKTHGYVLSAAERDAIFERLRALPAARRARVPGLQPARAPVILAGIVILEQVMELFGLDAVEVSEHDILRGAALSFA